MKNFKDTNTQYVFQIYSFWCQEVLTMKQLWNHATVKKAAGPGAEYLSSSMIMQREQTEEK